MRVGGNLDVTCVNPLTNTDVQQNSEMVNCASSPKSTTTTTTSTTATTTTSTPTTTTTTTTDPPPTTTTTTTAGKWSCTVRNNGECNFPADSQITGPSDMSTPYVDQNIWSPISGFSQTLSANSPQDWQAVTNSPKGNTGVVAFTNTGVTLGDPVSSFSQITGSVSENMNANANTSSWAMYDNWYNNWNDEVMIQYDFAGNGDCTPVATAQFGGSDGVPVQTWHLCDFTSPGDSGQTLDWKLGAGEGSEKQSESGGSFDLLAMTEWLETHTAPAGQQLSGYTTYLPPASTWTAISNGWEVASTGGVPETYTMNNYSLTMK